MEPEFVTRLIKKNQDKYMQNLLNSAGVGGKSKGPSSSQSKRMRNTQNGFGRS